MRHISRLMLAAAASTTLPLVTGCLATQSQLKHASDMQSAQLSQTRTDLANEQAARAASDSALAQQLGMVRGDVQQLRTDLETMKKDFGAKIVAMEDGLHFAMIARSVTAPFEATPVVVRVRVNHARSWPGYGDVSWQPAPRR